jgi:hypothetical protein
MKLGLSFFSAAGSITFACVQFAAAQVVDFNNNRNFFTATNESRLVFNSVTGQPLVGTNYVAQLYYGTDRWNLQPVTNPPAHFRAPTTVAPGTWVGSFRTLAGFTPGQTVLLQVRVWDVLNPLPPCFNGAWSSAVFSYTIPPQNGLPASFLMENFRSFALTAGCPLVPRPISIMETNGAMQIAFDASVFGNTNSVMLSASSNLVDWSVISSDATSPFLDTNAAGVDRRFYRFWNYSVISSNHVGFYRVNIPAGFSFLGNHLRLADDRITSIFPAPPNGAQVYQFNPATQAYNFIQYVDGAWEGDDLNMRLPTGGGVIISTPTPFSKTFIGDVMLDSMKPLAAGFTLVSSVLPQSLPLTGPGGLNFPVAEGDQIYQYDPASGGYRVNQYVDGAWEGDNGGAPPVPALGACFYIYKTVPAFWTRYFGLY